MPAEPVLAGAWAGLCAEFVDHKRSAGHGYPPSTARHYQALARHAAAFPGEPGVLTGEMVETYLDPAGRMASTVNQMRSEVRQFALFLAARGFGGWRPPDRWDALPAPRHNPRIITADEMARVIAAADRLPDHPQAPRARLLYGMLLRMLWCCGTRSGETVALATGDVDPDRGVVTIRHAKGGKTRLVPMSETLARHAREYPRRTGDAADPGAWFYPSPRGGHIATVTVHHRVQRLMSEAGVTVDGARPARVHDIRHSYAVAALAQMQAGGMDAYTCLPLLAAAMGHSDIRDTEYHLRLTGPAAAQLAADDDARHPGLYPRAD